MARLHDLDVDDYLLKSVSIEPLALNEEYVQLSADLAYWVARYAEALRKHLRAKVVLDRTEAELRIVHRERLLAAEGSDKKGRVTDSMVGAAVTMDPEFEAAALAAIEAEVEKVRLHGLCDAVRSKRDMLISLGAHVRSEMQGDPTIRAQHALAREVR